MSYKSIPYIFAKTKDYTQEIQNASKTATNHLKFDSNGLVIGDITATTLGRNILIDSDSVDIRNGSTVLASYQDNKIQLGLNSNTSVIEMCGGQGEIEYATQTLLSDPYITLKGNRVALYSSSKASIMSYVGSLDWSKIDVNRSNINLRIVEDVLDYGIDMKSNKITLSAGTVEVDHKNIGSYIQYKRSGTLLGRLGFSDVNTPCMEDYSTRKTIHLLHEENYETYCAKKSHSHSEYAPKEHTHDEYGKLAIASKTQLGAIIVGDNLSIDEYGRLSAVANSYTHPTYASKTNGFYKITVDGTGHVSGTTNVTKADITALGIPAQDTTYETVTTSKNGLMSSSDKTKLDGIEEGANKYSHPTYTSKVSGLYKITVDGTGHVNNTSAVTKADITSLGIPSSDTTYEVASTSKDGLMSSEDKAKLDSITLTENVDLFTSIEEAFNVGGQSFNAWRLTDKNGVNYFFPKVVGPMYQINPNSLPIVTQSTNGAMSAEDKVKLDNLSNNSGEVNLVNDVQIDGTSILNNKVANIPLVSMKTHGLMRKEGFSKLSGIEEGAEKNFITSCSQLDEITNKVLRYYKLYTSGSKVIQVPEVDDGKIHYSLLPLATTDYNGAMSSDDKKKLDTLQIVNRITEAELDEICV